MGKNMGVHQSYPAAGGDGGKSALAIRNEEIRAAFDTFAAMQNKHIDALANSKWNDIMEWRAERERVFASLQMTLSNLPERARGEGAAIDELRVALQSILEKEQLLAGRVGERQAQLENELRAMRKGRRVLKGYSPRHGCSPHARFLNNKT